MKSITSLKNGISYAVPLIFLISFFSFKNRNSTNNTARNIHLAGLVVDASTLEPVSSAKIYSSDEKLLGKTNDEGYYNINFQSNNEGQIEFVLKIKKNNYKPFTDKEKWGNFHHNPNFILYFGISKVNDEVNGFSTFSNEAIQNKELNYQMVIKGFESIKSKKAFEDELTDLKRGNENVLFKLSNGLYIASNTGWIKIGSDTDHISLNNKKVVEAKELNSLIKRSDIKGMTPVELKNAKFLIYTK